MPTNGDSAIFFTANMDPRHENILVGHTVPDTQAQFPILFEFRSHSVPVARQDGNGAATTVRTTVFRYNEQNVAQLEWTLGDQLGMMRMINKSQEIPMAYFYMPTTGPSDGRLFQSATDGQMYEWRRTGGHPDEYDLLTTTTNPPPIGLATFRRSSLVTTVGPVHAVMKYKFSDEFLLLEAVIALCINRRMHGGWRVVG